MASHKPQATLADYLAIAISPMLIMALVGSLVFFLLEVMYEGEHGFRMRWILFCFVFGAVLIGRVSMQSEIADRSGLYGFVLGGLVWLALQQYVAYSGTLAAWGWAINIFLIAIIWWSAHRLTWDCTFIDDSVDASGTGLLQAAGLDAEAPSEEDVAETADEGDDESESSPQAVKKPKSRKKKKADAADAGFFAWWDRYRRYQEEKLRKPHTPGVWVVYFSLAALPLYGLGQSLIPIAATEKRRFAFWLMICYVGSGLGLLLTTSFLGLRRYLRQRRLEMPVSMAGMWLIIGGSMVAILLVAGALLPRPYMEYPLIDFERMTSTKDRGASKYAMKGDGEGKGEGREISEKSVKDPKGSPSNKQGKQGSDGNQKDKGDSSSKNGSDGGKGQDQKGQDLSEKDQKSGSPLKDSRPKQSKQSSNDSKSKEERNKQDNDSKSDSGSNPSQSTPRKFNLNSWSVPEWLKTFLKWIVYLILGVGGLILAFRLFMAFLKFLSNFTAWAKRLLASLEAWWQGLWNLWPGATTSEEASESEEAAPPPRPFASYLNPFAGGAQGSPAELVRYSFQALEAFAREHGHERHVGETPLEFAERLSEELPPLETNVRRLSLLYSRLAYARGQLPLSTTDAVREFWTALESMDQNSVRAE